MRFEPYQSGDRDACLEIFRSNVPKFFLASEEAEYLNYLDKLSDGFYFCAHDAERIVACGGYWVRLSGIGKLVWGMVDRHHRLRGYGRALLEFRLKLLAQDLSVRSVELDTSQHNPGFFSRFGFKEACAIEDGFGPGLHEHQMALVLDEASRKRILE